MTDDDAPGVASRDYDGPDLDGTVQHISERPYGRANGETVQVVDSEGDGKEVTVGEPAASPEDVEMSSTTNSCSEDVDAAPNEDRSGQTTLTDYT